MKSSVLLILTALFLTTLLLGCGTLKGAGQDIEAAGESVQRAAD